MSSKSFYDLDFIIEMNERRVSEYHAAFLKVTDQFTVLIIIYSAIGIFLAPVVVQLLTAHAFLSAYCVSFLLFSILFLVSIFYTVRLILPADIFNLRPPVIYYLEYRLRYEKSQHLKQENRGTRIDDLLKKSYIDELEDTLRNLLDAFVNKRFFYGNALRFALFSVPPYLFCLGILISEKQEIFRN